MDLTQLFKANVKTVRLRNKGIAVQDKSRILKIKPRDDFLIKANDVRYQVTQLRDLLIENRAAYMRFGYHLKTSTHMTDEERNIIDLESEKIITICNQYISDLKAECMKGNTSQSKKQLIQHKLAILDILSDYLKEVYRIHNEQKESRVQHELDTYKLLKLESNKKLIPVVAPRDRPKNGELKYLNDSSDEDDYANGHGFEEIGMEHMKKHDRETKEMKRDVKRSSTSRPSDVAIDEDQANKFALEDDTLSPDDIQMFESENMQLLNDLKGLSDEVEQIEKNVVDIAKLQEIFTEKVMFCGIILTTFRLEL